MSEIPSFVGARPRTVDPAAGQVHAVFSRVQPLDVGTSLGRPGLPVAGVGSVGQGVSAGVGDRVARGRSPSVKRGYNEVAKETPANGGYGAFQTVTGRRRQPRKMTYGTNQVEVEGAEAAPIEVFVGNTNPRATEEVIKKVLIKCADNMPGKPKLEILDVKLLTNPDRDPNPRFKSWMVRVPYSCKALME